MADNDNLVLEDEENAQGKQSSLFSTLITIILLAAIVVGGYFAYGQIFPMKSNPAQSEIVKPVITSAKQIEATELRAMVPIRPFVVNLARSKGKRFLKVTLTMELNAPEVNAEVNENMSKIVDSILLLLSSKSFDDIYTVQGKFKLKDEITTRINRFLVTGHVKDVYYTEFVIQ
jgi:flagellar FliL protein